MQTISLAGPWELRLDPDVTDDSDEASTDGTVYLPGTTDEYGYGEETDERTRAHLARTHRYEGVAQYRRTVTIPDSWGRKRVTLTLERSRETELWIDGDRIGSRECLSTPHVYDVTDAVSPGECTVTLRVNNDAESMDRAGIDRSHAKTEHTQTNWNGVVGDLRLEAADPVWIEDVRAFPHASENAVGLEVTVGNVTGADLEGTVTTAARSVNTDETHVVPPREHAVTVEGGALEADGDDAGGESGRGTRTTVGLTVDLGPDALTWDEFSAAVYELDVSLAVDGDDDVNGDETESEGTDEREYTHETATTFGLRDFEADGTQFSINGTTIFLRGRTDCCVFPKTAYPPTSTAEWVEHMEAAKAYGINHYRFHSWCPPEAAFEAADRVGIYMQPELSQWDARESLVDDGDYEYYRGEAERILDAYGNHPSFVMFTLGNENQGDEERMNELVRHCRDRDDRRLYAYGANNFLSSPHPGADDDFFITANVPNDPDASHWDVERTPIRGTGHINDEPPSTTTEYGEKLEPYDLPVVGHEIGQFQVYPDFDEKRKYTGVLEARSFERFERSLADHYMEGSDTEFQEASGALAITCYREEIEAAFRTPGFGGFQLLGLDDFPGQGTALVGVLDSFMESKGLIEAHEWRRFCSARVPLLLFDRYTWTTSETFEADAKLANYGPDEISGTTPVWSITADDGTTIDAGELSTQDLPQGELASLGTLEASLADADAPARLEVEFALESDDAGGAELRTSYPIWVYPDSDSGPEAAEAATDASLEDVAVTRRFDERTRELLADGETVLLLPESSALRYSLEGSFQPDFWNYEIFKRNGKPGTLGVLFDSDHPLFESFPTDDHADWQWWRLLRRSRPIVLDDAPAEFAPTLQVIDTIYRNHKLGAYLETAVGDGKLAVCTLDLSDGDAPEVRQFRAGLASYLSSEEFDPEPALSTGVLDSLLNAGQAEERAYGDDAGAWVEYE
ncbi:sugar-binding domain-containing protein [Halomontanus rarus]|uniref:sugar-binding domain-containing protein n=1 Tax=Halomontanus rarus TaxID=3034020 RepID=UPI0023E78A73|nr:sugar-binding domain-containing protein [Halovivax sp. TS33]